MKRCLKVGIISDGGVCTRTLYPMIILGMCCVFGVLIFSRALIRGKQEKAESLPPRPPETVAERTDDHRDEIVLDAPVGATLGSVATLEATAIQQQIQIIQTALSFNFTNRVEISEQLEKALNTVYRNDPRIPRFVSLWKQVNNVVRQTRGYRTHGGDLESLFELSPDVVLNEFVELGIELLRLSDSDAAEVRAAAARWSEDLLSLEIVNAAFPLIKDALEAGDMTVEEAEAYLKEMSGFEFEVW